MAAHQQHLQHQRWLRDMGLPQQDLALLATANIHTARDLLTQSPLDLVERLNISISQAHQLLQPAALHVTPSYMTALELHSTLHVHSVKLLTGLPALDAALRIGIPPAAITELVGPASVGKSQFCYTLALQAAMPTPLGGLASPLFYIDTEKKFSLQRLQEMVLARVASAPSSAVAASTRPDLAPHATSPAQDIVEQTLNRVLLYKPHTPEELLNLLSELVHAVPQRDVKLVILDSIAAPLRTEFGGGEAAALAARGEMLGQQAALLKSIAEANRIPVLVSNQVTAKLTGPAVHAFQQQHQPPAAAAAAAGFGTSNSSSSDGQLAAALGTKWAHAVNVRLVLERRADSRVITIAKSPLSANVAVGYVIAPSGVQQAPDTNGQAAAAFVAPHSALTLPIANAPPQ